MGIFGKDDDKAKAPAAAAPGASHMDALKTRYKGVLSAMQQHGVRTDSITQEGSKLVIKAVAPSEDAKNAIWNAIKTTPSWQTDLVADIRVESTGGGAGAHAAGGGAKGGRTYTVKSGDTLSKISKEFYGDAKDYNKIFEANRDQLSDADKIKPGQVLQIP